jgi:DNA-binding GntR family transcriptional regulator
LAIAPQDPLKCDHGLRRQAIVQSLLSDVFEGRLQTGQHLVTQQLAGRFGVSHTPIREALVSLAGMGMIELLPNRGAVVRGVTAHEVREICDVRRALECEATRTACGRIDRAELTALAAALRRLTRASPRCDRAMVERARLLDSRLHDLVAEHCGNTFLAKELDRLKMLFRAFRDLSYGMLEQYNDVQRLSEETDQHLAVVDALLANDRRKAVRAMSRHIRSGVKYWSRALPAATNSPQNDT